jgi:ClpX C4-type zinc finger
MGRTPPPPVIASARVLAYAFVDDIPYRKWGALYSGDTLVEAVPCLAICTNLGKDIGPLLFHCSDDWAVLGTSGGPSVAEAKSHAERNYPGVSARWVDVDTTVEDALRYYDSASDTPRCAFCGRRPFEISGLVEGERAAICRECVEDFYRGFNDEPVSSESS